MNHRVVRALALSVGLVVVTAPRLARAAIERFAVLVGDDKGDGPDTDLRYAESDASKMYDVLKDLGGFTPANMVLLRGETAPVVQQTLIAVNDRVRAAMSHDGAEVVLFVYFSGHADAGALHMAGTRLDLSQLEQLVRGSAATFRILMLDACRSGALTRVKGGQPAAPFAIDVDERLSGEGLAFLTSSSANEDAQESDELRGSFFTHHFVSALLGPGDVDGDGRVTLEEAYRYAYDATVRSSSRTWAGLQHPTFRYEMHGQGKLVLTTLAGQDASRATLSFPPNRTYLVLEGRAAGAVVGEVDDVDRARSLSVRPGRYFVRGRATDALLEGTVDAGAGASVEVKDDVLHRTEYARLVRKGGADVGVTHGPEAGYLFETPMKNESTLCQGAFAGYAVHWPALDLEVAPSVATRASRTTRCRRATIRWGAKQGRRTRGTCRW
jgi:caspase domain-containing protein